MNELGGDSQEFSRQAEEAKKEPAVKTVSTDSGAEQTKAGNISDITKRINPNKSIVESVIDSMASGEMDRKKKEELGVREIGKEEKLKNGDVSELQSLVSRISDTVPEKKSSFAIAEEEILDRRRLPKLNNIKLGDKKEEKISKEIDKEMEARINRKTEEKTKEETKIVPAPAMDIKTDKDIEVIKDLKIDKNTEVDQEKEGSQKNEDAKRLKELISRISKTAGKETEKETGKESFAEKMERIPEKKEEKDINTDTENVAEENKTEETKKVETPDNKKSGTIKIPLTGRIQRKLPSESLDADTKEIVEELENDVSDHDKTEDQKEKSFWSNISEKLKKDDSHKETDKIKDVQDKKIKANRDEKALKNKVEKPNKAGTFIKKKRKIEEIKEEKNTYSKVGGYVLPENRLIHEKQRFYSSVSKKIKLRKDKGEMEGLKNTSDMKKKRKILSREEEYGKLKKSIISKYHVKLFQLPWKKIIPVSLIILLVAGASFYYAMSVLVPELKPQLSSNVVFGEELPEFTNIEKKITISESSLKGLDGLEKNAKNIFDENYNLKVIKLVIVNTEDKEGRNILSLKEALGATRIIDTENNKNYLPEKFLEISMDKYNFFIFRTKEYQIRYGIVIGLKDRYLMSEIMREWEKERSINKKMIAVLKPLFAGDRNYGDVYKSFNYENYSGVEIRYVHLMDEGTALNYFVYSNDEDDGNDLLVITTSRESAHTIADLLAENQRR